VEPDMALFGKALGNGYPVTAVIGRRDVMEAAQRTFISSTFWTDRIGPTAALKTLEVMERERSWDIITQKGMEIRKKWEQMSLEHSLPIHISGLPALITFSFDGENAMPYKTYLTQEMLKRGYLAGTGVFVSIAHTDEILSGYFEHVNEIFREIKDNEIKGNDILKLLDGPVCHSGFKRLN
jgi:glutamate-1-semialdehyde 2,1-aminomutase